MQSPPLQAVPKKKGDSGKKALAKILGQILNGAKKAERVTKSWWEIFSVSSFCLMAVGWLATCDIKSHVAVCSYVADH